MPDHPITVFGGTGFLGRSIVRELVDAGRPVRLVARRPALPDWAEEDDRIELVAADLRNEASVARAVQGADAVVNAVSLYKERRGLDFEAIHVAGAARLARLAREAGIERLVQISGIGCRLDSPSPYVRARARGEHAVVDALSRAILLRPSVLYGPQDAFLSSLAGLTRLPAIPLFGRGETRLQPVHVVDVARAVVSLVGAHPPGRCLFELGGPEALGYREIVERVMAHLKRDRPLVPVPFWGWHLLAALLSPLPGAPLTRDQVWLMQRDNLVGDGVGTFRDLGIVPRSLSESLPSCLAAG
ncbi:complex I NDUFA9 subunit family protein [Halomonas campaniensis]|uniref:complex I NDUFA9 subunit family protein n=1 Tax=Halomonas campaniensis TaxID=213554 RepID=UPI0039708455